GLAGLLRLARQAQGSGHRRAARNAAQNAFLAREAPRHGDGLLIADLLDAIDQRQVQVLRDEARADTLNLVRGRRRCLTRQSLADDRRVGRLDGDRDDLLAPRALDVSRDAGQRTAGADARDENVDLALGILPDLG